MNLVRENRAVGKWESCFWISTFPSAFAAGAVGMWESRSDFQGLWEERETRFWFSSLSIARHFHGPPRFSSCATLVARSNQQLPFGLLHFLRRLRIRFRCRDVGQLIHRQIGAQESRHSGQLPQYLPRRRIPAIHSLVLAFGVALHFRNSARSMEVQIRIEMLAVELVERLGMGRGDVAIADVLADPAALFGLRQPVVVAMPRPRLGLFHQQFVQ